MARRFRRPEPVAHWRTVGIPGALVIAMALATACGGTPKEEAEPGPAEVPTIVADVAKVARRTLMEDLVVRGAIAALPNADVKVSALVPGRLNAVSIAEGDTVTEGQVIAEIDRQPLQEQRRQAAAALQQARAQLENARLNLQRTEQMFQRGIAAGKEVEDARTTMANAEAAIEQTTAALNTVTLQLDRTQVRSPISGQVVKRMVSVGEQVDGTAGQPIAEIANLEQVELAASIPAEQIARITVGQTAAVSTEAYPNQFFPGIVVAIAPSLDAITNSVLTRIRIVNAGRLLKVGMFAQARVELARHANALIVPTSALVRNEQGAAVYVVTGDVAQRTAVVVGLEKADGVEILSGVTEGQNVLTSAVYGLGEKARRAQPAPATPREPAKK